MNLYRMKKLIPIIALATLPYFSSQAVNSADNIPTDVEQLTDSLKRIYAPDKRLNIFQPDYTFAGKQVMLRGETTSKEAKSALLSALKQTNYEVLDCMQVLPNTTELGNKTYGVVNVSVCNMRVDPDFSSEMMTQALMGMPVRILDLDGWYRIQSPDNYISWVHKVGVHPMTKDELHAWNRAPKIVVTEPYGFVYTQPNEKSQTVSDVVAGNRLKLEGQKGAFYQVTYPDGRTGFISKRIAMPTEKWRKDLKYDEKSILETAHRLMGIPYIWAGKSTKGMDCSGFMSTILYIHDVVIPRDADQQAASGKRIDIAPDFSNLQPGDFIFFGRKATADKKERVVHVGMYIGNKRFIHSQGDIHISSFDSNDPLFDAFNLDRLMYASRIIPYINQKDNLKTTDKNEFYRW